MGINRLPSVGPSISKLSINPTSLPRPARSDIFFAQISFEYKRGDADIAALLVTVANPDRSVHKLRIDQIATLGITGRKGKAIYPIAFSSQHRLDKYTFTLKLADSRGTTGNEATVTFSLRQRGAPPIAVSEISPAFAASGASVTLRGVGLQSSTAIPTRVFIGSIQAQLTASYPGALIFTVPEIARSGPVRVENERGSVTTTGWLQVAHGLRGPLYHHGTNNTRTRYHHVNIEAGQSESLLFTYLGPECCAQPGPWSGTFFVLAGPYPTDQQYTDPSAYTREPGRITGYGIVIEYSHPNSIIMTDPVAGLLLPGGRQTVQVTVRVSADSPPRSYRFNCGVNYYQTSPDGTPILPYQDEIFLSVENPSQSPPPVSDTFSVEVLTGLVKGPLPGDTFTIKTRWRVPQRPQLAASDQALYGIWNDGPSSDRIEHEQTVGPDGTRRSRNRYFSPGVTELEHIFRVKEDARPGTVSIDFNLHDHIDHRSARAEAPVEIGGPDVEAQFIKTAPKVVLRKQRFSITTRWFIPDWVENPRILVSHGTSDVNYEQSCFGEPCTDDAAFDVPNGEVFITSVFNVKDQRFSARRPGYVRIWLQDGNGPEIKFLRNGFTVSSEPRIRIGGHVSKCGNQTCVLFQRVPTGESDQRVIEIINEGSEDLTFSVQRAPYPFNGSQSPGGHLGWSDDPRLGSGYYFASFPVTLVFTAPEDDQLSRACTPDPEDRSRYVCEHKLTITSNDPAQPTLDILLKGYPDPPPKLDVAGPITGGNILDFGIVPVNQSATREIEIINVGGQFLDGYLPASQPGGPGGFQFSPTTQAFHLNHNQSRLVTLSARPSTKGKHEAKLVITADEVDEFVRRELILRVITGPSMAVFDRTDVSTGEPDGRKLQHRNTVGLGYVTLAAEPHPSASNLNEWALPLPVFRTIVIRNDTQHPASLNLTIELIQGSAEETQWIIVTETLGELTSLPNLILQPGEEVPLNIRLNSTVYGVQGATLIIRSDAADQPETFYVYLSAEVVRTLGEAEIMLMPPQDPTGTSIDFGEIPLYQTAGAEISIRNVGIDESSFNVDATLAVNVVPETSAAGVPPAFTVSTFSGNELPLEITDGEILQVGFKPEEFGEYTATLDVTTSDPLHSHVNYALRGAGVRYYVPVIASAGLFPDPLFAYNLLSQSYHQFDLAMRHYLGTPLISNFVTYAKHLTWFMSGEQRHLRAFSRLLMLFTDLGEAKYQACVQLWTGSINDVPGFCRRNLTSPDTAHRDQLNALVPILRLFSSLDSLIRKPFWDALSEETNLPFLTDAVVTQQQGTIGLLIWDKWVQTQMRLHSLSEKMVAAELQAYLAITAGYRDFLSAANQSPDGIPPAMPFANDPNGLLSAAFQRYGDAKRSGDEARALGSSPEAEQRLAERQAAVEQANQLLAIYHQLIFQSVLYDASQDDFSQLPAFTFHDPHGPQLFTAGWGDFYTRMGIDPAGAPANPFAITGANAPPMTPAPGTLGAYLDGYLIDSIIHENPAVVPLPGTAMFRWAPPVYSSDLQTLLTVFNEALHIYGAAEAALNLFAGISLPVPGRGLVEHVGRVGQVSAIAAGICAAVSLGTSGAGNHHIHEYAQLCSIVGSGVAAGLGDPLAIASGGILLLKGMVELAQAVLEAQAVYVCWPNCQAMPTLEQWLYR